MTPSSHSVTRWIERLRTGDPEGARSLWTRFFSRMVGVARGRLASLPRRAADEEDAALAAFVAFQQGLEAGRFPDLANRTDLWRLLVTLTVRMAGRQVRDERRDRRGGGQVRGDSAFRLPDGEVWEPADDGPGPEELALVADTLDRLLGSLDATTHRPIGLLRLEGYTVEEIAERLGCAACTVRRRLELIRCRWEHLMGETEGIA